MRRSWVLLLIVAAQVAACRVGPSVQHLKPALDPAGVLATIHLEERIFDAELLEVRDAALLVRLDQEILLVPYSLIRRAVFHEARVRIRNGRTPSDADREELRLISRFPQGLSPELESALLRTYGQNEVTRLGDESESGR